MTSCAVLVEQAFRPRGRGDRRGTLGRPRCWGLRRRFRAGAITSQQNHAQAESEQSAGAQGYRCHRDYLDGWIEIAGRGYGFADEKPVSRAVTRFREEAEAQRGQFALPRCASASERESSNGPRY